jgi:hypothetical protein
MAYIVERKGLAQAGGGESSTGLVRPHQSSVRGCPGLGV